VEITVEEGTVLLWVKPVSTRLAIADSAGFTIRRDGLVVLEIPATWYRPDEGWFVRIPLEDLSPGSYEVRLEAAGCSNRPRGTLVVER